MKRAEGIAVCTMQSRNSPETHHTSLPTNLGSGCADTDSTAANDLLPWRGETTMSAYLAMRARHNDRVIVSEVSLRRRGQFAIWCVWYYLGPDTGIFEGFLWAYKHSRLSPDALTGPEGIFELLSTALETRLRYLDRGETSWTFSEEVEIMSLTEPGSTCEMVSWSHPRTALYGRDGALELLSTTLEKQSRYLDHGETSGVLSGDTVILPLKNFR